MRSPSDAEPLSLVSSLSTPSNPTVSSAPHPDAIDSANHSRALWIIGTSTPPLHGAIGRDA
jgi:hypothetical protein